MGVLTNIEPKKVFGYFEKISEIPHGSFNTKQISDYCVSFAKEHNLRYIQDEANNVIIFKDATKGYENSEPVIIQGHLDMVCCVREGLSRDMDKEALDLQIDGDFVHANGTTLGGDDGIAVSYALAILDSDTIEHPPLEVVFTVDEEVGMLGATAIDLSHLRGKKLLNIDSEVEGVMTVSCAGGASVLCKMDTNCEAVSGALYEIKLSNLSGGHSGIEIDKGRANAIKLFGRLMSVLCDKVKLNLVKVTGGVKDNAIADSFVAEVAVLSKDKEKFEDEINSFYNIIKEEYKNTDKDLKLTFECVKEEAGLQALNEEDTNKVSNLIAQLPCGVQAMSKDIENLVETSLNHGILNCDESGFSLTISVRSSVSNDKKALIDVIRKTVMSFGGEVEVSGDYPAWEYKKESPLRNLIEEIYREQYGEKPVIEAIHAGLECGVFCDKIDGLDAISFGPNLLDIHTAEERMSISSVQRVWKFILEILKRSK